jgi:hypothetical protein
MFSCEQISVSSLPPSLSPPLVSLTTAEPAAAPRYDTHLIASMQATTAYLLERVSMLEMRLIHQQDIITQLKKDHETILSEHILLQKANYATVPLTTNEDGANTNTPPQNTSATESSDAIKRRKAVF